ncbi:MAG: hypothetical protein WCL25_03380 [bacterium]
MPKGKVNIGYRFMHLFTHHPWLKLISLILAVLVWFYVRGEINRFN